MELFGKATGLEIEELFKPVEGDQTYWTAFGDDAEISVVDPMQIKVSAEVVTTGVDKTFIVTESLEMHPLALVAVTIYFVVADGEATGLMILEFDKPVEGDHENFCPWVLDVVNVIEEPLQVDVSLNVDTSGKGKRFIAIESEEEHPAVSVTTTLYMPELSAL